MQNNTIDRAQLVAELRNNCCILERLVALHVSRPDADSQQIQRYLESMVRMQNLLRMFGERP